MSNSEDRIQNALYCRLLGAAYHLVKHVEGRRQTLGGTQKPASLSVHPTQEQFEVGRRGNCALGQTRVGWTFSAIIAFDSAVTLNCFTEDYAARPTTVQTDDGDSIIMLLDTVDLEEPPENQPSSGTRATIRFVSLDI